MKHYKILYRNHIEFISANHCIPIETGQRYFYQDLSQSPTCVIPKSAVLIDISDDIELIEQTDTLINLISEFEKNLPENLFNDIPLDKKQIRESCRLFLNLKEEVEKFKINLVDK